jgi:hypothetical protein
MAVRVLTSATLAIGAVAWFVIGDHLPEGPILWTVAPGHGLTLIDLPGVGALLLALAVLRPVRTTRRTLRKGFRWVAKHPGFWG